MLGPKSLPAGCNNCALCGKWPGQYHMHISTLSTDVIEYFEKHHDNLPGDGCVCKSHCIDAKRHADDDKHCPKWKRTGYKKCTVPTCNTTAPAAKLIKPLFASPGDIKHALHIRAETDEDIILCASHYHMLYKQFSSTSINTPSSVFTQQPRLPCVACGSTPKRGHFYNRHCPNPHVITEHLNNTVGTKLTLDETDTICYTCYKLHNQIMHDIKLNQDSYDSALIEIIDEVTHRECTDKISQAINKVVTHVATQLLHQKAILLPQASKYFLEAYGVDPLTSMYDLQIEMGESIISYSSRWLLGHLIVNLGVHMRYKCVHNRIGIILYRHKGDLLKSLSYALGASIDDCKVYASEPQNYPSHPEYYKHVLKKASFIVNDLLHAEIKKGSARKSDIENDPKGLNMQSEIQIIDPLLWEFISTCTESIRSKYHSES